MLNKATIIGNVGQKPDTTVTSSGKKCARLSVATSTRWTDKQTGEKREATEWHRVVIFNEGLAGVVENYVKKGSRIYVEGKLQTRKWQDSVGQDRYTTEIVVPAFGGALLLLDKKPNDSDVADDEFADEIPFN